MTKKSLFIILLVLSPGLWQLLFQPIAVIAEWLNVPKYLVLNISSKAKSPYFTSITELRWGGRALHRDSLGAKIIYNPGLFWVNEFFDFVQYTTPKLYFLAGDGSNFSPRRIEPLSSLLFPFWILGLLVLVRRRNVRSLWVLLITAFVSYLIGHKNLAILLPLLLIQLEIAVTGLISLSPKYLKFIIPLVLIYGVYITTMNIWLNFLAS